MGCWKNVTRKEGESKRIERINYIRLRGDFNTMWQGVVILGDFILGGANGVVVISPKDTEFIFEKALRMQKDEEELVEKIKKGDELMKILKREDAIHYEANPDLAPVFSVKSGEKFKVETLDAFEGDIFKKGTGHYTSEDIPRITSTPFKANPVGGPIYVEGSEIGDLLAIHIWDIIPGEKGWTGTMESIGLLHDKVGWEECHGNYGHVIEHISGPSGTTSDGRAVFEINGHKWIWDLNPHIGTIFTCPEKGRGVVNSLTVQGPSGGNQDIRDVCKGNTIYLNCFNKGGLIFLGDVHASQGDAEFTGIANETDGDVILSAEVIKNKSIPDTL